MILVYEYASHGSLDRYLSDVSTLTWTQHLRICVGAARGLHDPMGTQQRVSDFGLSKIGPANQAHTYLVSNVVGTPGNRDPLYWELGFLSKESGVYSFGVVLFEILCGRFYTVGIRSCKINKNNLNYRNNQNEMEIQYNYN
ncbi:putative non-specific serine/threonine protein kinase [Helianthus anomalus]